MRSSFLFSAILLIAAGCSQEKTFEVNGEISGADGKTLYFEKAGVSQTTVLDSVKLKGNGKFDFRQPAVDAPEFFRLRLGKQTINLAVDSTETVTVNAAANSFASNYTVTGSIESEKIKTINAKGLELRKELDALSKQHAENQLNTQAYYDSVNSVVDAYKQSVRPFIFENPRAAVAYYTLFQRVNNILLFDPYNKTDYAAYGAVATSWDTFHKSSDRSRQLTEIAMDALRQHRAAKAQANAQPLDFAGAVEQNQIEIVLPDIHGNNIKLSDMKGKVVLLDFTAYQSEYSGPYNMALAKLYDKFKERGFTVYQVSLDTDENFWKVTASNLPWVTVRDKDSVYSRYARSYNVSELPTSFLLGRDGAIIARGSDVKNMEEAISKLL